jgi:hypothetical protein
LVRSRNKLAIISSAATNPVTGIKDTIIRATRVEVWVSVRNEVSMFPTQAVNKSYLAKKKIVLPATREKVPVTSQVTLAVSTDYGPPASIVQLH